MVVHVIYWGNIVRLIEIDSKNVRTNRIITLNLKLPSTCLYLARADNGLLVMSGWVSVDGGTIAGPWFSMKRKILIFEILSLLEMISLG